MANKTLCFLIILLGIFNTNAQITSYPYVEDFEAGEAGWTPGGTNSSWQLGNLDAPFLVSDAPLKYAPFGKRAWITNENGLYNNNENSWVQSPVFDLSSLTTPYIQLKIWWDCQTGSDGAVLQSSVNSGASWQNVGDISQGTNWFNNASISSNPGGQSKGWSGEKDQFDPLLSKESLGWVTAIFPISNLTGENNVVFRIAFSSNNTIAGPGVAFDYIQISNTSCYAGDNFKPADTYARLPGLPDFNSPTPEIVTLPFFDNLNTLLDALIAESSKSRNSKVNSRKFVFKKGPKRVFVKDDGDIDFPNTGQGQQQEYVFEYTDSDVSCNGIKDVAFLILKVGGNDYGGTNIEEQACVITDTEGVQVANDLYDILSLEAIRCYEDLDQGFWYEISGNNEIPLSGSPPSSTEGMFKYEGCSSNTAIITITTENNCTAKDLGFSFDNAIKYSDGSGYFFEVDVMMNTNNSGTFKLGSGKLHFSYNTEAFGENINLNGNFQVINDGGIVEQSIDSDSAKGIYGGFSTEDVSTSVVSWSYSQIYSSSTFSNDNINGSPTKLCRLILKYQDESKDPMLMFQSDYPLDNQFSSACGPQAGGPTEFSDCESGESGFNIINDNFNSTISQITLSNTELRLVSKFLLYPNPTKSILNLKGDITKLKGIDVYSITGQHIMSIKKDFEKINISHLEPSIYFIKLNSENASKTFKIIKE